MNKCWLSLLLGEIGLFLLWSHGAIAETVVVSAEVLYVRDIPIHKGPKLGRVFQGQSLEVLGRHDNWIKIGYHVKLQGWVSEAHVTPALKRDTANAEQKSAQVLVKPEILNIRDAPQGRQVGRVFRGQQLSVLKRQQGWIKVDIDLNQPGWVHQDFVSSISDLETKQGTVLETVNTDDNAVQIARVNTNVLKVRDAPEGRILGKVYRGQRLQILQFHQGWANITYPVMLQGWIHQDYIAFLSAPLPTGETPVQAQVNTDILNVRDAPEGRINGRSRRHRLTCYLGGRL